MRLSSEAIQEFKEICKEEFGEDLSDAQAEECALNLLHFFQVILHFLPNSPEYNRQPPEEEKFDNSP